MYTKQKLIWDFFRQHPYRTALSLLLGFIASILLILLPISLGKYFDLLFGYHSYRAHFLDALPFSFWDTIPQFITFFITITLLWQVTNFGYRYFTAELGLLFSHELRTLLFEHQMFIPLSEYDQKGYGKYLLRYSGDLAAIRNYLVSGVLRFTTDLMLITMALIGLFLLSPPLLSGLLIGLGSMIIIIYFLNRILYDRSVVVRNRRSGLLAYVNQRLQAMDTIQAFNRYVPEQKRFADRSQIVYQAGTKYQKIYQLIYTLVPVMLYLTLALTLFAYVQSSNKLDRLHQGNLLAFVLLFLTVMPNVRRLLRVTTVWKVGHVSFEKLIRILQLSQINHLPETPFTYKGGAITFQNLGFSYNGKKYVLKNLNAQIPPHSGFTFIRGRTGSGKTTLIKLLLALYQPTEGQILIDGQNIHQVHPKSLRKYITVVSEEFPLLGRTVFEAISYSRKADKRPKAQSVLNFLQADLPPDNHLHLDDRIGELGDRLSKSQIKMLLYARAMISNKPIFLIEDPFKNLPSTVKNRILLWLVEHRNEKNFLFFTSKQGIAKLLPQINQTISL